MKNCTCGGEPIIEHEALNILPVVLNALTKPKRHFTNQAKLKLLGTTVKRKTLLSEGKGMVYVILADTSMPRIEIMEVTAVVVAELLHEVLIKPIYFNHRQERSQLVKS